SWRIMVSFGFALFVFYIATKPPPPKISLEAFDSCLMRMEKIRLGDENSPCVPHRFPDGD
ncbi:hypothetical protein A2U01_0032779, partial [Trifolium medium]|nr:hypothetical protein [Trifolium medium]